MSVITNIVLLCEMDDEETVEDGYPMAGKVVDRRALTGGDKVFCKGLFAWAENYCRKDELLKALGALPWRAPSGVMLMIEHEDEICPEVYRLGETVPYAHNSDHETVLGELSLEDDERLDPMPKFVKVVRARAD